MQELIIKNVKITEYKEANLNKIFDPQGKHQKSFEFKNSTVSSPHTAQGKLYVTFYTLRPEKRTFPIITIPAWRRFFT